MIKLIKQAAETISNADALVICAGAGMGVDSGLPDFRGNQGFWKAYPPFARLGLSFIDMANPGWFSRDPNLAWGFYGHRLNLYRKTIPHEGFNIIRQWCEKKRWGYFVFTSNVDGQFQKAGFDDDQILECHGSIHHLQCIDNNCLSHIWPTNDLLVNVGEKTMKAMNPLPNCHKCGKIARPNILMFGDWNWLGDRTEKQQLRFNQWLEGVRGHSVAVIECGAGTGVPTVRMTSETLIRKMQATLVRINVREPQVPTGQIGIAQGAMETLKQIDSI